MLKWSIGSFTSSYLVKGKCALGNISASKWELKGRLFSETTLSCQCSSTQWGAQVLLGGGLVSWSWKVCASTAPQCCGSGPALLPLFSRMMCVGWNPHVCIKVQKWQMCLLAMVCYIRAPWLLFFYGDSWLSLNAAEFCLNRTLLATGQIRRLCFQVFCVNGNIIMLAMLSLKNKLIKSITLGDVSCCYTR